MTIRATPAAFRFLHDVMRAVGDGIRAHKDFGVRVRQGTDPVEAATIAMRQID